MQEEVENRSVNLAITTTRMTARAILSGIRTYLYYHNRNKANEIKNPYKHGKQSVKELIGQGLIFSMKRLKSTFAEKYIL